MGFASGLPCVPDMLKNRSRTKGKRAQGTIKNHRSGSAARQGGAPALPTSALVGWILGENGKKVGFSFGIVITLSIFAY